MLKHWKREALPMLKHWKREGVTNETIGKLALLGSVGNESIAN